MPIRIRCRNCGAVKNASNAVMGRKVRCPACDHPIRVPSQEQIEQARVRKAAEERVQAEERQRRAEARRAKKQRDKDKSAAKSASHGGATVALLEDEDVAVHFGSKEREEAKMDMTPMVDVTFLLLIFFMVTAAFSLQKSLEIPNPRTEEASTEALPEETEENPDTVTVFVDSYNTFTVMTPDWEREAPSEQELLIQMREARQGTRAGTIPTKLVVRAHIDAFHEKVVAALDAGAEVGMEEIQLMTTEEDD